MDSEFHGDAGESGPWPGATGGGGAAPGNRLSPARLAALAEASGDLFFALRTEPDVGFEFVSDAVVDHLGYTADDLLRDPLLLPRLLDPRDLALFEAALAAPLGADIRVDLRWRHRDGRVVWMQHRARKRARDDGSVVMEGSSRDVTSLQLALRSLAESESRFRLLAENASDVVCLARADGVLDWVSESVERSLGWGPTALVGTALGALVHPEDGQSVSAALAAAAARGTAAVDARWRHRDGSYRWMAVSGRRLVEGAGITRLAVGLHDISGRVAAEQSVAAREALWHDVVDTLPDPWVLCAAVRDERGRIVDFVFVDANEAACRANRTTREELLGARLLDLFPDHGPRGYLDLYARVVDTGQPWVVDDLPLVSPFDGREHRYDNRAVGIGDAISLTWRDVTDRYEAAQALAESRQRYRLLAENASDVVVEHDMDGVIAWVSPSVTEVLGWPAQHWIGRPFGDFVHPEDLAANLPRQALAVASGADVGSAELRFALPDGGFRWMSVSARVLRDAAGQPSGAVESLRDVDELVRARHAADTDRTRLRATLDSLPDPHVLLRPHRDDAGEVVDFVFAEANRAVLSALGTERDAFVGHRLLELFPGLVEAGLFDAYRHTLDTGEPLRLDDFLFAVDPDGPGRRFDLRAVRVGDELSAMWRDVTDHLGDVDALAEREHRLRLMLENSTDAVFEIAPDDTYRWVSPSVTELLGWERDELVGSRCADLVHPEDYPALERARDGAGPGQVARAEARFRSRDGSYRWMSWQSRVVDDGSGAVSGRVVGLRDVEAEHQAKAALRFLATHDPLTRLLNRAELLTRLDAILAHPQRSGSVVGVLFLDLDGLKAVNDAYGHAAGDAVIVETAQRILTQVRSDDLVARIGGDEFVVALPGIRGLDDARTVAAKIHEATARDIGVGGPEPIRITVSIGVTIAAPPDDAEVTIRHADKALYAAKHRGRAQTVSYGD